MQPDRSTADAATDRTRAALAGFGWFVALAGFLLAFAVPALAAGHALQMTERPWFALALPAVVWLSAAAVLAWPASRPVGVRRTLALRGCAPLQLAAALILAVALAPAASLASGLARNHWAQAAAAADPLDAFGDPAKATWSWVLLLGCVAPAVAKEVAFRGFIGRRLVAGLGRTGGVVATSLLFAVAHIDPVPATAAFVLGVALHAAFLATRSLLVPVAMHAAYNVVVVFADRAAFGHGYDPFGRGDDGLPAPALVFLGSAAVAAAGWVLAESRTRWRLPDGGEWNPHPLPAPLPPTRLAAVPEVSRPAALPLVVSAVAALLLVAASVQVGRASKEFLAPRLTPGEGRQSLTETLTRQHREQGDALLRDDRATDAIVAYTKALDVTPNDGYAVGNRGLAHADLDNTLAAERDLQTATRLVPGEPRYHRYLGWARMELGRHELSLDAFADVLRLVPDDDYALRQRGRALLKLRRWREAADDFSRAIRTAKPPADPETLADLHAHRGKALVETGHYEQAADDFADALRHVPMYAMAAYELAWLRAACPEDRLRDGTAAVTLARTLCEKDGGRTTDNVSLLAAALMESGARDEAVRAQAEALALAQGGRRDFHERVLAMYRDGRPYRLSAAGQ